MGWMTGQKYTCHECGQKAKKLNFYRRGFRFCSAECVRAFVVANPLAPAESGSRESYEQAAYRELELALDALGSTLDLLVGETSDSLGQEVRDNFARYNDHVLQALPYLYALERAADVAYLESSDFEYVNTFKGSRSQCKTLGALLVPVYEQLTEIMQSFPEELSASEEPAASEE